MVCINNPTTFYELSKKVISQQKETRINKDGFYKPFLLFVKQLLPPQSE